MGTRVSRSTLPFGPIPKQQAHSLTGTDHSCSTTRDGGKRMRDRFPALRTGAVVVLCFFAWSSSGASPRKPPIDIDLSGRWVFNETASREQNQNARGGDARGMPGSQRRPVRGVPGGTDLGGGFPGGRPGDGGAPGSARPERPRIPDRAVSYTHLTLPTIYSV